MARTKTYDENMKVALQTAKARTKLQQGSERRAVVNAIVDAGGRATVAELNARFGYDLRGQISALIRFGWLEPVK